MNTRSASALTSQSSPDRDVLSSLALSTMWMQHRLVRLADFALAARDLGFGGIEVSHIVTDEMIGDADVSTLGIWSVHFPAPIRHSPFGRPAEALLSSSDDTERGWAVAQGRASIDLATTAGARAVCLHLGEVSTTDTWSGHLSSASRADKKARQRI